MLKRSAMLLFVVLIFCGLIIVTVKCAVLLVDSQLLILVARFGCFLRV